MKVNASVSPRKHVGLTECADRVTLAADYPNEGALLSAIFRVFSRGGTITAHPAGQGPETIQFPDLDGRFWDVVTEDEVSP